MKPPLIYLFTLSACSLGGWWLGHVLRPPVVVAKPVAVPSAEPPSGPDLKGLGRPTKDGLLMDRWDFARQVATCPEPGLDNLLKKARSYTDPNERRQREEMVALRYAEFDPEMTMTGFLKEDPPLAEMVMNAWANKDGKSALEWAETRIDLADRTACTNAVQAAFATTDPLGYLKFVEADPQHSLHHPTVYASIFESLTKRNPEDAIAHLQEIKDPYRRLQAYSAVAETWGKKDPQAALAWAKGLSEPHERANALQAATRSLAATDPHAAILALNLIDPAGKPTGDKPHQAIAAGLARQNFDEAVKWVKALDPTKHNLEELLTKSVLPALPNLSAANLINLYQGVDVRGRSSDFAEQLNVGTGLLAALLHWKPQDVAASLQEATSAPSSESRDCVVNYLCWKLAQDDPAQALATARAADKETQEKLGGHLARPLAKAGKVAELAEALKLAGTDAQASLAARDAAELLSKNFPEHNTEFLKLLPDDLKSIAAAKMVPSLLERNPEDAIALASSLPADAQPMQMGVIAAEWAKLNSTDTMRWAQSLPAGPQRDAAAANIAGSLLVKEPHNAFNWAHQIGDPALRVNQLQYVINEWLFSDAAAAQRAIVSAQIPADELAKALQPLPDNHPNPRAKDRDADYEPVGGEAPTPGLGK